MAKRLWKRVGVGIYERKLRCGCTLESWPHSSSRRWPCAFHAKADADLAVHEWWHLSLPRRFVRTALPLAYLFGVGVVPICMLVGVILETTLVALIPIIGFPLALRAAWRAASRTSYPSFTVPFTGVVEAGDYGPNDVELVAAAYVPRGHSTCFVQDPAPLERAV